MPTLDSIPKHKLGANGPLIPALGLGLMGLSHETYGATGTDEEKFRFLDRAHEIGARNWDTADLYGDGEELVGRWFKRTGKRDDIFLASKFGFVKGSKTYEVDSSYEYCKKACNESLRLLGVESIDLYYMHHANPDTPIEETMRALAELQAEGKIKHIGLSAVSSNTLRRAVKIAPVAAVQSDYSPFVLDPENEKGTNLIPTCRELGVAFFAAMPLGRGLITPGFASGTLADDGKDVRPKLMPRFLAENRERNTGTVSSFQSLAEAKGCTAPQLSLAWLLRQGDDIFPIPGTKRVAYLEQNWAALDVKLSDEDVAEIRAFLEGAEIAGSAMPPGFEKYGYVNTREP